jgi:hypothetical protein
MSVLQNRAPSIVLFGPAEGFEKQVAFVHAIAVAFGANVTTSADPNLSTRLPVVALGITTDEARRMARRGIELLAFIRSHSSPVSRERVVFNKLQFVPEVLRGRQIDEQVFTNSNALDVQDAETVHACAGFGPVWVSGAAESSRYQLVAGGLPGLGTDQALCEIVKPHHLASLAPLLSFFLFLKDNAGWCKAPLMASFMFDDPNLHAGRYGYLCFHELVLDAAKHNYHVSLATVPIDAWYAHQPTARLLRQNQSVISLLIHGNAHTKKELTSIGSEADRLATLAQSLSRIQYLERCACLRVARVMAAPHGACSEEMLHDMRRLGFEAACISSGSLSFYNSSKPWTLGIGLQPSDFVYQFPVVPRFRLSKRCHNQVLLAALLRQPLIPVGHHWDLADGLDVLAELADFINSLGDVRWMDMTGICRSNFRMARDGGQIAIEAYSNRLTIDLKGNEERLLVIRAGETPPSKIRIEIEGSASACFSVSDSSPISIRGKGRCELSLIDEGELEYRTIRPPRRRVWPLVRRVLVEARDRTKPLTDSLLVQR